LFKGRLPYARVIFGPDGSLYGTTELGGYEGGLVFKLRPSSAVCRTTPCEWAETVLYRFATFGWGGDGWNPGGGDLNFDREGNIYGTTLYGGLYGDVYKLSTSDGGWTNTVLFNFQPGSDGGGFMPDSGVVFDHVGNLYGTTQLSDEFTYGVVYRLTPSNSGWIEKVLYRFQGRDDGAYPVGGVIFDRNGNLYGTTAYSGSRGGGTVFQLSPLDDSWTLSVLYSFTGNWGPVANLTMDAAGNLYGTTSQGGAYGYGAIFKLTQSNHSWTYTSLHDFTGGSDGAWPLGSVIFDARGNLYSTAQGGGLRGHGCGLGYYSGCGVVVEITP
jgi:uncharacterized repeat protein (TIGR03803 family)